MRRRAGSKRLLAQATRIIKIESAVQDRNLRRPSRRRSGVRDKPDGGSAGGSFMSEVDIFGSNGKGADYVTSQAPRNDNHAASIAANRPARQRGVSRHLKSNPRRYRRVICKSNPQRRVGYGKEN